MNIFVANLNYRIQEDQLRQLFEQFGTVTSAKVIKDHETGRSKGFGFVEMPEENEALAAIEKLNGEEVDGKGLTVNQARPRSEGGDRGGNRGGGYQRRGRNEDW